MRWLPASGQRALLDLAAMPLGKRLVRGAAASLVMTAASIMLGIASSVLLGRTLGPRHYGLYSLALLLIGMTTVPFFYGMTMLLTRETGKVMASGNRADMTGLLRWSYWVSALAALGVTVMAGALLWTLRGRLDPDFAKTGLLALPMIGLSILMPLNSTVLRGLGGLVRSQFCDLALRPALALLFVLIIASRHTLGASSALIAQILAVAVTVTLSGWWLFLAWREMPQARKAGEPPALTPFRLKGLMTFSAVAAVTSFYGSIDSLLLGAIGGTASLGIYRIALVAVQLMPALTLAISTIVVPSIARLWAEGDRAKLQRLLTITSRATLALALPLGLVLILAGRPLLLFGFGDEFAAGAPALAICAAGQVLSATMGPVFNVYNMAGHEQTALRCMLAGAAINAGLCLVLIAPLGPTGAALAATAGNLVTTGLMARNERRLTGVTSSILG